MRILIVGRESSEHVANWVSELQRAGQDVLLFSPFQSAYSGASGRLQTKRQARAFAIERRRLRRFVRDTQPDVLNSHYASAVGLLAAGVFHPTVVTIYGSDVSDFPHRSLLHRWALRRVLVTSESSTVASRHLQAEVEALNFPIDPPVIVPFGVDIDCFAQPALSLPRNMGPKFIIGTTKGCEDVYGMDILIRAFARFIDQISGEFDAELHIYGGGSRVKQCQEVAMEVDMGDRVTIHGRVGHEQVATILRTFDVFAAPSRRESFGVAVVEAMAAGVPCLVSDAGGLPELAAGGSAVVVPRGDVDATATALVNLATNAKLRGVLGLMGQQRSRDYSYDACVARMLAVFRSAVSCRQ